MKNKKGFTLVELIGVITILMIVLGLAIVAYKNINGGSAKAYYKNLEESLLMAGSEYYAHTDNKPNIFGEQKKVTLKELSEGNYLEKEVKDKNGETCDLEASYVGAYKDNIDRTKYFVCLTCNDADAKTDNLECGGKVDYTLGVRAYKKDSGRVYSLDGSTWSSEDVVLVFETLNAMQKVVLKSDDGSSTSCNLKAKNGIKTCSVEVSKSVNYTVYGESSDSKTKEKEVKILIDKTPPTFSFLKPDEKTINPTTGKEEDIIEVEIEDKTKLTSNIENLVQEIEDSESKIKMIEYSFEWIEEPEDDKDFDFQKDKEEREKLSYEEEAKLVKDYYHSVPIASSFEIKKELKMGIHFLKVRVENYAGLQTEKMIKYIVYKKIEDPTPEKYCYDLTYTDKEQVLVKEAGEGFTFNKEETKGTDAKEYEIKINLKRNYRYQDNTDELKMLVCEIKKKDATITAKSQTIIYGNDITQGTSKVTVKGLIKNHTLKAITLTKVLERGNKSHIVASAASIMKNKVDKTPNYNFIYVDGLLTVKPAISYSVSGTTQSLYGSNKTCYEEDSSTVTATCSSFEDISTFTTSPSGYSSSSSTTYKTISLSQSGIGTKEVTGTCTTIYGAKTTNSYSYIACRYSTDNVCDCIERESCESADYCGTKKCKCSTPCEEYIFSVIGSDGAGHGTEKGSSCGRGSYKACGSAGSGEACYTNCKCNKYGSEVCKTCPKSCKNPTCSCAKHDQCWHA